MPSAVGLVFKHLNDIYYTTNVNNLSLKVMDVVIARTIRAKEIGRVIQIRDRPRSHDGEPFVRKVLRLATEKDFQREDGNREREKKAFSIAVKKIEKLNLPMTLIRVHYLFDHSRILFYFKAAGKVDFRQLVRELASVFKARIELRQIGVRDEAKMLGGIATCGRTLCCTTWLRSFTPVTVRMAKDQHLSLNPNKISGLCGRLQCCLEYEQKFYEETLKGVPNMGAQVRTPVGDGKLIKANIFTGQASVLLDDSSIAHVELSEVSKRPRPSHPRPSGDGGYSSGRRRRRPGEGTVGEDETRVPPKDKPDESTARPEQPGQDDTSSADRPRRRRESRRRGRRRGRGPRRGDGPPPSSPPDGGTSPKPDGSSTDTPPLAES